MSTIISMSTIWIRWMRLLLFVLGLRPESRLHFTVLVSGDDQRRLTSPSSSTTLSPTQPFENAETSMPYVDPLPLAQVAPRCWTMLDLSDS